MTGKKILLVEDEAAIREMTTMALERAGFGVVAAEDASSAERLLSDGLPDLILLDWMLPGGSGIELARRLRRDEYTREVPIIMLTARSEEEDRIRGFDSGADDYVTKPFSPRELIARIKAVIRRASPEQGEGVLETKGLVLDSHSHRVSANGNVLEMGPTEFRLLQFFMAHPERVYSRTQLLDMVWSRGSFVEERTVDVHIRRLRKVLENDGFDSFIQTVRGAGYRFSSQV
jgi:two-component system phosphate regulon response regulator PhoB